MAELNDPERLARFEGALLQMDPDEVLDACVDEAARIASMPIGMINLVLRHVQLFRAHRGLPPELALSCGTSRDASFCQVVVRDERPLLIEDALRDPRVPQDLVDLYGIRAYAGVPVRVGGQPVGSLCVIDTVPRRFDPAMVEALTALGERVGARLAELAAPAPADEDPPSSPADLLRRLRQSARLLARAIEAVAPTIEQMAVAGLPAVASLDGGLRADLRAAVACHADFVGAARELGADAARLARAGDDAAFAKILADARAIERDLEEAAPVVRLAEGVLSGKLGPAEARKATSVARQALRFHSTALAAVRRILRAADAMASVPPAARGAGEGGAP